MDIKVRKIEWHDLAGLLDVMNISASDRSGSNFDSLRSVSYFKELDKSSTQFVFVAIQGKLVIGAVWVSIEPRLECFGGSRAYVEEPFILRSDDVSDDVTTEVWARLLNRAITTVESRGCRFVHVLNCALDSLSIYEECGFARLGNNVVLELSKSALVKRF